MSPLSFYIQSLPMKMMQSLRKGETVDMRVMGQCVMIMICYWEWKNAEGNDEVRNQTPVTCSAPD